MWRQEDDLLGGRLPFQDLPLCTYCGHTSDILDLSWSKVGGASDGWVW